MRKSLPIFLLALLLAALFATGCGSSSSGSDEPALTKAEFVKQGNAICKKANKKRTADYFAYEKGLTTEEIVSKFTLPSIQEIAKGLDGLAAPEGDEEKVEAIVTGIEEGVDKSEEQLKEDPEGFEAQLAPTAKLAQEYGLTECAEAL